MQGQTSKEDSKEENNVDIETPTEEKDAENIKDNNKLMKIEEAEAGKTGENSINQNLKKESEDKPEDLNIKD